MKRKIIIAVLLAVLCVSLALTACKSEFTVTFETNGGTAVESIKAGAVTSSPVTTKDGFYFIGWFESSDFAGEAVTFPYKLKNDVTLYAKWGEDTSVKYLVNFVTNGGSQILADNYSVLENSPQTERPGYVFVGWYDNIDCSGTPIAFPYKVSKNVILYAKWTEQKFRVEFNSNGGSYIKSDEFAVIETEPVTTRDEYSFAGWFDNEELSGNPVQFPFVVTEEITLHAKWQSNSQQKFTATFQTNGGTPLAAQEVNVVNQPVTTRDGYELEGWYLTSDCSGNKVAFPYTLTEDTTFYAKWVEKVSEYLVRFETNGGSSVNSVTASVIHNAPATSKPGYTFAGWFDNQSFNGNPITFPYRVTKATTLYAKWVAVDSGFTLTFNPKDGSRVPALTNVTVVNFSDLPTTTRTDYEFEGWYLDDQCTVPVRYPYTLTEDTLFYAKWKLIVVRTYNVYLYDADASTFSVTVGGKPVTLQTDSEGLLYAEVDDRAQITITDPTKVNATFEGWYSSPAYAGDRKAFPMEIVGSIRLYAKWKINVEPNPDDSAELQGYLNKTDYTNFSSGYGLIVRNTIGVLDQSFSYYFYNENVFNEVYCEYDGYESEWKPAISNYVFERNDNGEKEYMVYSSNFSAAGEYQYNGHWYDAEAVDNLEKEFRLVYLAKTQRLDSTKFYKYDGFWYATEDYVNEAGHLLLGNSSGDPAAFDSRYSEIALKFDSNGVITYIKAKASVVDTYDYGTGMGATHYYYEYDIPIYGVNNPSNVLPSEDDFLLDQVRPSGLYPELNPNDTKRNNVTSDGIEYSLQELQSALGNLINFTSYYTLAGNTFSGYIYSPLTIHTRGNVGKIIVDDYSYEINGTVVNQYASNDRYFVYKPALNAFFLALKSNGTYKVYSDAFSYKNTYDYNHYLLGLQDAEGFNCKYPTVGIKDIDVSGFAYNAKGGYFEFVGSQSRLNQVGKALFGDMDVVYPEASETEYYTYLRLYMNDGKLVKVLAASRLELYGEANEYFMKELVITDQTNADVGSLPAGFESQCIVPGEAMENGNVDALSEAIGATQNVNHKYTDRFVFDNDDELGGVGEFGSSERDIYIHYNGITRVNSNLYLYFKNGKLFSQRTGSTEKEQILLSSFNGDVEKANSYALWAYNMAELLDSNWFYQGKDGKYYGKADCMTELSKAIGRFSGSEQFLENNAGIRFSASYRWSVVLDFVSVEIYGGKLSSIYYSGVISVVGSNGSHTKPFSGTSAFSYDNTALTLPVADTVDETHPAVYEYINANYDFAVDNEGVLHIGKVDNATSYKITVYELDGKTFKHSFTTGDLTVDLKTVAELGVTARVDNYYLTVQAIGNGTTFLDGSESDLLFIEISTLPKIDTPVINLDRETGVITVEGDYSHNQGYHYSVKSGGTVVKEGNVVTGKTVSLADIAEMQSAKTYTIEAYMRGIDGQIRDSEIVTILYTVPKTDGTTFLSDLFKAIDYSKSFSVSFSAQDRYRYHYFTESIDGPSLLDQSFTWLNNNSAYRLNFSMYFEATLNKGVITFGMYNPAVSSSEPEYNLISGTFKFTKNGETLSGEMVRKVLGKNAETKQITTPLLFTGVSALESDFTEYSGQIDKWPGLAYRYQGDLTNADTQKAISDFSLLDEIFGETLTYTGMHLNMSYNSDGTLSTNSCSLALVAQNGQGHTMIVSFCFANFGSNLTNWVKD